MKTDKQYLMSRIRAYSVPWNLFPNLFSLTSCHSKFVFCASPEATRDCDSKLYSIPTFASPVIPHRFTFFDANACKKLIFVRLHQSVSIPDTCANRFDRASLLAVTPHSRLERIRQQRMLFVGARNLRPVDVIRAFFALDLAHEPAAGARARILRRVKLGRV